MSARHVRRPAKIRVRLTLLYAAAFFVAGAVLVALMMLYLAHALDGQAAARIGATQRIQESTATDLPPQAHEELRTQFVRDRDHVLRVMFTASLVSLGHRGHRRRTGLAHGGPRLAAAAADHRHHAPRR